MIRFEQVSKRYPGGIDALTDLSFEIEDGQFVVLCGHSGAGKSTLLNLIPAIERPTQGTVTVNQQNVTALKRSAVPFLRRSLGLIFQDRRLLYDRSVFDNVMLPLSLTGYPPRDAARRAQAALDKVGLRYCEKAMPIALSGGEQQRLAIARAIVNRPSILLADEPTAHLDTDYARDIAEMFRSFNQVGVTVVIATHDDALFAPFASKRLTLGHGCLLS